MLKTVVNDVQLPRQPSTPPMNCILEGNYEANGNYGPQAPADMPLLIVSRRADDLTRKMSSMDVIYVGIYGGECDRG